MPPFQRHHNLQAACRLVIWCLLVALPVFGVSGTLVELLGPLHVHRAALVTAPADPMAGWVDMRRAAGLTTIRNVHGHTHGLFARHHHDRVDADVVALDAGVLQADASDDGGASGGSFSHVIAVTGVATFAASPSLRFNWQAATSAAALPWTAGGPLRPPRT